MCQWLPLTLGWMLCSGRHPHPGIIPCFPWAPDPSPRMRPWSNACTSPRGPCSLLQGLWRALGPHGMKCSLHARARPTDAMGWRSQIPTGPELTSPQSFRTMGPSSALMPEMGESCGTPNLSLCSHTGQMIPYWKDTIWKHRTEKAPPACSDQAPPPASEMKPPFGMGPA